MKMKLLIMYFFCSIIIIDNINALSTQNESHHHSRKLRNKKKQIRPSVSDMTRYLNPSISEQGYIPKEVNYSNYNQKPEIDMLKAQVLGNIKSSKGVNEKPTIYEVIKTHKTSPINHPNFGNRNQYGMNIRMEAVNQYKPQNELKRQTELNRFGQGRLAIPVKLENSMRYKRDPRFSNYESPSFLSKKLKKKQPNVINVPKMPMISPALLATSAKDVKLIKKKLNKAKTRKQKLNACNIFIDNNFFSKIQ